MSALSMNAAPRISGNVSMSAVKDNHMDTEMSKTFNPRVAESLI